VRSFRLRLATGIAALATLLLLTALVLETREHVHAGPSPHWLAFVEIAVVLGYGPLAVLVVSRQPRNPVPWFLLYFATTAGLQVVLAYAAQRMLAEGADGARWLAWVTDWMVSPAFATMYVLLLQLFPDGKPASPRFRPLVPATVAIIVLAAIEQPLTDGQLQSYDIPNPAGVLPDWVQIPTFLAFALVSVLSLLSLVVRFRASAGRERLQLQLWLFAAISGVALFLLALAVYLVSHHYGDALFNASAAVVLGLPLLAAFAIVRHRLYDIDVFLNRALTYGLLSAVIAAAYAGVVFGVGALTSGDGRIVSALAAAVCALAFAPLRSWLQRGVNRLLYGARHEPDIAVETVGRQLGAAIDPAEVLPALVAAIARALRLGSVAVELADGDGFVRAAEVGAATAGEPLVIPLVAHGETVGRLVLAARRPGERLSDADRRVLEMLSVQAAHAVLAVRLNAQLARSREQLVSAREEERRRLRRDLHDGLGPTLAAVGMQLGAASALIDQPEALRALHAELQEQTRQALADIRRLVYELRPPALDELGLAPAIAQQGDRFTGLAVRVHADGDLDGLPAAVEVAAYRIAAEAITNAARHGEAQNCLVRLSLNGALDLEVVDDGAGLPRALRAGVGLSSMRERAAELGGTCEVGPAPGGGTRVAARLPIASHQPDHDGSAAGAMKRSASS
jgi:signal transduction histidine kinase